jgi:hypothetical protein
VSSRRADEYQVGDVDETGIVRRAVARKAFRLAQIAYAFGATDFLAVLDAHRTSVSSASGARFHRDGIRWSGRLSTMRRHRRRLAHHKRFVNMTKRLQTTKLPLLLATLAAGVIAATSVLADQSRDRDHRHGHWGRATLTTMDADNDGTITRAEIEAHVAARASEIDADGDGAITVEELIAHRERMRRQHLAERLAAMDQDGDGKISVDEYAAAQSWRMARFDRSGDGQIELEDMRFHRGQHRHR